MNIVSVINISYVTHWNFFSKMQSYFHLLEFSAGLPTCSNTETGLG